jgi:Rrf2 family protein
VRLEITRRADLATRALLALAQDRERTKASVLAERVGTTPGFLSQAMTPLVARGWVRSEPGPSGCYTAVVDPSKVSVLEIIEAVEGRTDTGRCVLEDRPCSGDTACVLHGPWSIARDQLLGELAATPLSTLTDRRSS